MSRAAILTAGRGAHDQKRLRPESLTRIDPGAAGSAGIEIQDDAGHAIPGYALEECREIVGDEIDRVVTWKEGSYIKRLAGQTIRLLFQMKDADLYSFRFRNENTR